MRYNRGHLPFGLCPPLLFIRLPSALVYLISSITHSPRSTTSPVFASVFISVSIPEGSLSMLLCVRMCVCGQMPRLNTAREEDFEAGERCLPVPLIEPGRHSTQTQRERERGGRQTECVWGKSTPCSQIFLTRCTRQGRAHHFHSIPFSLPPLTHTPM